MTAGSPIDDEAMPGVGEPPAPAIISGQPTARESGRFPTALPLRHDLFVPATICLLTGAAGWVFYGLLFRVAPTQDFMVFYTAARASIEGHLPLIFDGEMFTAQINKQFGNWFYRPLDLHPWVYPPTFLLLVIPLGLLPFIVAYVLFAGTTFVLLNCALRHYVRSCLQRWLCGVALLLSPATAFTVAVGQNSFLTTALLVGSFGLLPRSPLLAGTLLGLLTCKPQLWILVPVALCAAREWTALSAAIVTGCLIAAISVAAFGIEPWREWLTLMLGPSTGYQHWLQFGRLNGQSAYTEAVLLGASAGIARLMQDLASSLCGGLVWACFRSARLPRDLQLAVLLTAVILAAPHVSNYDTVMVAVAVLLLLCRVLKEGFRFGDTILIVVVWNIELLDPPQMFRWGLLTPLVLCLFLAVVIARGVRSPPLSAAAPRSPPPYGLPAIAAPTGLPSSG